MSALEVTCPGCDATLRINKTPTPGARLKCPKCGEPLPVGPSAPSRAAARDDQDDAPNRIQKTAARARSSARDDEDDGPRGRGRFTSPAAAGDLPGRSLAAASPSEPLQGRMKFIRWGVLLLLAGGYFIWDAEPLVYRHYSDGEKTLVYHPEMKWKITLPIYGWRVMGCVCIYLGCRLILTGVTPAARARAARWAPWTCRRTPLDYLVFLLGVGALAVAGGFMLG
jgi:hypothetical protein